MPEEVPKVQEPGSRIRLQVTCEEPGCTDIIGARSMERVRRHVLRSGHVVKVVMSK